MLDPIRGIRIAPEPPPPPARSPRPYHAFMTPPDTIHDQSFGVIPYRQTPAGGHEFLLIQHLAGHWAFPKGHAEGHETPPDTARRELAEETGITDCALVESPALEECYRFTKRSGKQVHKTVTYHLGRVDLQARVTVQPEEIADHAWADAHDAMQRLTFDEGRRLLQQAVALLDPTAPSIA